jgi:glucose-1-phosphate adenylyltransferase
MNDVVVEHGAVVRRAILDKNVQVAAGASIGVDPEADRRRFTISDRGVVVVAKGVKVAADG